jgi:hypothetical protein
MYAAASVRRRYRCADINEPLGSRQQGLELSRDELNHPRRRRFGDPSRSSRETPIQVQPSTPGEEKREVLRGAPTSWIIMHLFESQNRFLVISTIYAPTKALT